MCLGVLFILDITSSLASPYEVVRSSESKSPSVLMFFSLTYSDKDIRLRKECQPLPHPRLLGNCLRLLKRTEISKD